MHCPDSKDGKRCSELNISRVGNTKTGNTSENGWDLHGCQTTRRYGWTTRRYKWLPFLRVGWRLLPFTSLGKRTQIRQKREERF